MRLAVDHAGHWVLAIELWLGRCGACHLVLANEVRERRAEEGCRVLLGVDERWWKKSPFNFLVG